MCYYRDEEEAGQLPGWHGVMNFEHVYYVEIWIKPVCHEFITSFGTICRTVKSMTPLQSAVLCPSAKVHYIRQLINDEYITQGGVVRTSNNVRTSNTTHICFTTKVVAQ